MTAIREGEYYVVAVNSMQVSAWADPSWLEAAARSATKMILTWGDAKNLDVTLAVKP
jgi:hypothetical protein